jgi:hypothetical protein
MLNPYEGHIKRHGERPNAISTGGQAELGRSRSVGRLPVMTVTGRREGTKVVLACDAPGVAREDMAG